MSAAHLDRLAPSYAVARRRFLDAASVADADVESFVHPDHRGPGGEELAIDVATLGSVRAENVLMIVSGTHGVEGFAGSALQSRWLDGHVGGLAADAAANLCVVLVHGFNPYGFAWHRRTNEDNVDLNRNFIDWSKEPPSNAGYDELAELLVPESWDESAQASSSTELLERAAQLGQDELQTVITGGQYRHVAGVFYGGTEPVWSHRWLVANADRLLGRAGRLGVIDLHTGLGPWGHGELIVHQHRSDPVYVRANRWWGDVNSMRDGESVSANLSGDWLGRVAELVPNAELTAAALEFGTVDPILVLQALRAEAWVHARSEPTSAEAETARAQVRAAFADDDPAWLEALATRFDDVAGRALAALGAD